ncbi:MAG: DUF1416 domain-containing protein [Gemmatimonadales bacterium]|nr:MAG: DUF1416 domain-containing protein [Gemmatimonadales bacterium]
MPTTVNGSSWPPSRTPFALQSRSCRPSDTTRSPVYRGTPWSSRHRGGPVPRSLTKRPRGSRPPRPGSSWRGVSGRTPSRASSTSPWSSWCRTRPVGKGRIGGARGTPRTSWHTLTGSRRSLKMHSCPLGFGGTEPGSVRAPRAVPARRPVRTSQGRAVYVPALLAFLLLLVGPPAVHAHHPVAEAIPDADPVVVVGSVVDREDDRPLSGAQVRLRQGTDESWIGAEVTTNEDGEFRTPPLRPGTYTLSVRSLGYHTLEQEVEVEGASPMTISVELAREVLELEGIAVVATRNPYLQDSGFYERQRAGFGPTLTREEILARSPRHMTDVVRGFAGVELVYGNSPTAPFVFFRRLGCRPDIVIDGANYGPDTRMDDLVQPNNVQGLELYRGGSSVPPTLSTNPCGAILLWTMSDDFPDGERFGWTRVAIGVVVLGITQLLRP